MSSIATHLVTVASSLSSILDDINVALVAKGSTAAATLDGVDEKIQSISGGGGIIPTGTKNIGSNGDYDVTNYATAHVDVPQGITPTGEISITENGTYNVTNYASAEVAVSGSSPTGTTNITTNGTHNVSAYAYANVNVPTGTPKSASDITVSGPTVTVPAGLYSSQATKTVSNGTQPNPTISVNSSTGVITASYSQSAGYVSSATKSATQSLTTKSSQTYTPGTSSQTISSGQYLTGTQTILGDSNLVSSNIKNGISIFGVSGSYSGGGGLGIANLRRSSTSTTCTRTGGGMMTFTGLSSLVPSSATIVGFYMWCNVQESSNRLAEALCILRVQDYTNYPVSDSSPFSYFTTSEGGYSMHESYSFGTVTFTARGEGTISVNTNTTGGFDSSTYSIYALYCT